MDDTLSHLTRDSDFFFFFSNKLMASSDQTAKIIDGKAIAHTIRLEIAEEVRDLSEKHGKVDSLYINYSHFHWF